jgi:hypothetical protein
MMDGRVDLVLDGGVFQPGDDIDITEPAWKLIRAGVVEERNRRLPAGFVK